MFGRMPTCYVRKDGQEDRLGRMAKGTSLGTLGRMARIPITQDGQSGQVDPAVVTVVFMDGVCQYM